jgi:MFS family permease
MLLVSPIAGQLSNRVGSKTPLVAGTLVTAAAFGLLAFAHETRFEIYLTTALMGIGIGLAFSAMANLIVEAVRPDQTGVATGMNTIMRTIGGSVGTQVSAAVIAATAATGGLPTERGFTIAFAAAAGALVLAFVAALKIPARRARPLAEPAPAETA